MAKTQAGTALTERYRRQTLALRAATIRDLLALWPLWEFGKPDTYEKFTQAAAVLVASRGDMASALAARYYQAFRMAEEIPGDAAIELASRVSPEVVRRVVDSSARPGVFVALKAGKTVDQAFRNGFVRVSGDLTRQVLDSGRNTILGTVERDKYALGWARVTDGDPCPFCAMLAGRGPVYKSEGSAGFDAHGHCGCCAEPTYSGSEWPGKGREYEAFYQQVKATKDPGENMMTAFRREYRNTYTTGG